MFKNNLKLIFSCLCMLNLKLTLSQHEPEVYAPCKYIASSQIFCTGIEVNDETLKNVGLKVSQRVVKGHFRTLYISTTAVKSIGKNLFPDLNFENIRIEGNNLLVNIDPEAFVKQKTKHLIVRNNTLLSDVRIFDLSNHIQVYQTVEFDYNAIQFIPENAFKVVNPMESHTSIKLNHNKISKIGSNAFKQLSHLTHLSLSNNLLTKIDENAFNFINDINTGELVIDLNHNHLSSNSFNANSLHFSDKMSVRINLENNLFTDLPELVFKPLIDKGLKLYLFGNNFQCGCGLKWIVESLHKNNINDFYCSNLSEDIKTVTIDELNC